MTFHSQRSRLLWRVSRLAFCLLVFCITGCPERTVDVREIPPAEVTISQPVQRKIEEFRQFPGRVEAVEDVEIRARVTGYLTEVNFVEGDVVDEGAVLFKIDPRPFDEVLKAANADAQRWEALIAKNKADLDRQTKLLKQGAGLQEDYDSAKAAVLEAEASLSSAQAAIERATLDVDFTTITAPVKGRVGRAMVTKGNLVTADQTAGTPLTTLVSVDPMYVYFNVDELTILEAQQRSRERDPQARDSRVRDQKRPIYIGLANEEGFPHKGIIDFVDNRVDTDTGTLRVRGLFTNENEYLTAGLFVKVKVPLGEPETQLLVPQTSIGADLNQKYVLVVSDKNIATKRPVELGIRTEDGLQVVEKGLTAEDWVVIGGIQRVRDGATVDPTKSKIETVDTTTTQTVEQPIPDPQPDQPPKE